MPFSTKKMGNTGTGDVNGLAETKEIVRTINMNMGVLRQDLEAMPDEILSRIPAPDPVVIPPFPEIPPYPDPPEIPPFPEMPDIPDYTERLNSLESKIDSLIYHEPKDYKLVLVLLAAINFILILVLLVGR